MDTRVKVVSLELLHPYKVNAPVAALEVEDIQDSAIIQKVRVKAF